VYKHHKRLQLRAFLQNTHTSFGQIHLKIKMIEEENQACIIKISLQPSLPAYICKSVGCFDDKKPF
jgi:hypothetical protein